jgi:rhomboid protease GluP
MAIGLTPKHEETIEITDLTHEEWIVIGLEAVKKLEWSFGYISLKGFIAYTKLSMSSFGEELKVTLNDQVAAIQSQCTGSELMDWGRNKRNVERFISTFNELKGSFSKEQLEEKITEMKQLIVPNQEDALNQTPLTTKEKLGGFLSIFKPSEGYYITPILINLNILVFIAMVVSGVSIISPESEQLLNWGANFKPVTLNGQWWRLLSCCFIHIGVLHLLMNMYALMYIGLLLEPLLGKARFFSAYIVTGIAASLTSLLWNDLTISAGASGAIFGMYGVFLAMLTTNHIEKSARQSLLASIGIFVVYNLMSGMQAGIDNAAHIGGLVSGIAIGYIFYPSLKETESKKYQYMGIGFITVAILVASVYICSTTSNDIATYDEKMKDFSAMESKALEVYKLPENTPNEKVLDVLNNQGIKTWEQCLTLITDLEKLDLPLNIQNRNEVLKQYCLLRIECYKIISKAISENTNQYQPQIDSCNAQIDKTIKSLSEQ